MHKILNSLNTSIIILLTILVFVCCKDDNKTNATNDKQKSNDEWTLVFKDNFNNGLAKWEPWKSGAFNNEIQLYTPEQLTLNNGILEINVKRKSVSGPTNPFTPTIKNFEYVSGRLETRQTFGPTDKDGERTYKFMARIKLPSGHGMWPAFWTYGSPWPTKGEIDILEARGGEPLVYSSNLFFGREPNVNINIDTEVKHEIMEDLTSKFHIYEMVWSKNTIELFFDGKHVHTWQNAPNNNISNMFGKKQKVVFNTAVGGWFIEDRNSTNFADSSKMEIDWVRVYKK